MNKDYSGWTLYDDIIIVEKQNKLEESSPYHKKAEYNQGYIVDPKNSKQLKSAINWGTYTICGEYDKTLKKYPNMHEVSPIINNFKNGGFKLKLLDSADGSSQGGRLSFWNCLITKDNQEFEIGINADLLIDVLKNNTFINGECQTPVFFARKNGNVGVLTENMEAYKQALKDMQIKADMQKGKTTKYIPGHNYITTTLNDIYVGEVYQWYVPISDKSFFLDPDKYNSFAYHRGVSFDSRDRVLIKLDKPIKKHWLSSYIENWNYLNYFNSYMNLVNKCPSRVEGNIKLDVSFSIEELNELLKNKTIKYLNDKNNIIGKECYYNDELFLTMSPDISFDIDEKMEELICSYNITIIGQGDKK